MDSKEINETIEYLKLMLALSVLPDVEKDAEMVQFFKTLVLNGCPFDAIVKAFQEMAQKQEDKNRKTDKGNE